MSKDLKNYLELVDIEMPLYEPQYEDDQEGLQTFVPDINDADPDTHDCYIGVEVELLFLDRGPSYIRHCSWSEAAI